MLRRIKLSTFSWVILFGLSLCLAYFWRNSLISKQAKTELVDYENALFCQNDINCRQIFLAKVLESRTTRSVQNLPSKYSSLGSSTVHNITCNIRVMLSDSSELEVTIPTKLDLSKFKFDVPDIALPIPSWNYDDVSAHSFPVGAILHVEVWHGKATFIYSKYINATNYSVDNTVTFPITDSGNTDPVSLDTTGELAAPTILHPLLHYTITNANVQGVFRFSIVLAAMFSAITYLDNR